MQSRTRAHSQTPPTQPPSQFASGSCLSSTDPYVVLMNQMNALFLSHSEDMIKILANQDEFKNMLAYV